MYYSSYSSKREKLEQMQWEREYGRVTYLNDRINAISQMIQNANDDVVILQEAGLELVQFHESGDWKEAKTAYDNMKTQWLNKLASLKDNALKTSNTAATRVAEIEAEPPIDLPTNEQQQKAELLTRQIEMKLSGNKIHDKLIIDNLMKSVQMGNIVSALAAAESYEKHTELFHSGHRSEIYENMKTEAQKAQERLNKAELNNLHERMVDAQKTIFRCRTMENTLAKKL